MKFIYSILFISLSNQLFSMDCPIASPATMTTNLKIPRQIIEIIFAESNLDAMTRGINQLIDKYPDVQRFVQSSQNVQAIINNIARKFTTRRRGRQFSDLEIALSLGKAAQNWLQQEYMHNPQIRAKIINWAYRAFIHNQLRDLIKLVPVIPQLSRLVFEEDKDKATMLLKAQQSVDLDGLELVRLLIDYGVDVDQPDATGLTPLIHAARFNRLEQMHMLLTAGADPNKATQLPVPLLYAVKNGSVAEVKILLDAGATIDEKVMKAAQIADTYYAQEIIKILQEKLKNPALKFNALLFKL